LSFQRSNSQFDLRHRLNLSYAYSLPFARNMGNGLVKRVLDGWTMSGIFSTQTGFPASIFAGSIRVLNTTTGKIQTVSDSQLLGAGITYANGDATQVKPSAFPSAVAAGSISQPFVGQQGTSGRNHLRLDGLTDFDAALAKAFKVTEGKSFQLRWEVFNVLNHPNLSGFTNTFTAANFGQYTTTATNMRQMQVAARFQF